LDARLRVAATELKDRQPCYGKHKRDERDDERRISQQHGYRTQRIADRNGRLGERELSPRREAA
jgi:hypothetical protein